MRNKPALQKCATRALALFLLFSPCVFAQTKISADLRRLIDTVSVINLSSHIKALQFAGGYYSRVNFTPGNDSAVAYVKRTFDALPHLTSVENDTFYIASAIPPLNLKPLVNTVATLRGKKDPSKVCIVGAHLDCSASNEPAPTWSQQWRTIRAPGADDNATGVAAVLELARVLSDSSLVFSNDYTIRFVAFAAEESGPAYPSAPSHPGSSHYAQAAKARGENILAMISVDMIGYNQSYDYQAIISNAASEWLGRAFIGANDSNAIGLITNQPPFPNATYSDHDSFWGQGYPAICLIENAPPWQASTYYKRNLYYHTSRDTFELLNMQLVRKVTQATLATIASLSGTTTSVNTESEVAQLPTRITLYQNYPNPFNPMTKIQFTIVHPQLTIVKVSDILGRDVATLVNEVKEPGTHTVQFDGSGLASGVYFYRLEAGNFVEVKKLLLLR